MLSIVTGTLNRKNLLPHIIKNTVDANEKIELVLVDGGSADGTIEYIKNLNHSKIKLIEVGQRSTYPHFMNLGIMNSKFDLVCQWNDDVLLCNKWEEVFDHLDQDHDFYLFNWKYGNMDDIKKKEWLDGINYKKGWCLTDAFDSVDEIVMNYGIYKKHIFQKIGMYNSEYRYYYADGDMSHRAKSFGFKNKNLYDIKVCSLITDKKAIHHSRDTEIYNKNRILHRQKKLPENLEFLK